MTLTNRLLAFLILSHAGLLICFSVAVYAVARAQLYRQLEERSEAALDTLAAAAESEEDGWEWDARDRRIGRAGGPDMFGWAVYDDAGRRLDGSGEPTDLLETYALPDTSAERTRFRVHRDNERWRITRRVLVHTKPEKVPPAINPEKPRYRTLVFVAAAHEGPVESVLATLAWSLAGSTAAVLALVALGGRWWCRRALAPVARMTAAVKGIGAGSLDERVPAPEPRDELRELAEAFNALLARVQVGYERQARFTSEASHQLRTPLAGMLGQLELALKRERDPEEYRRTIALAVGQVGHLNHIVEMLLFLARSDGEGDIAILETVDLVRLIDDLLEAHWSKHSRNGDLAFPTPAMQEIVVRTQPALLGQALHNLLENALNYSKPGSPVEIRIAAADGAFELAVRDRGSGIAAADLDRIFTPFYRTAEASRSPIRGTGLGLAVARRIAESLGGTIRVESEPGSGSTFSIMLPASNAIRNPSEVTCAPIPAHTDLRRRFFQFGRRR